MIKCTSSEAKGEKERTEHTVLRGYRSHSVCSNICARLNNDLIAKHVIGEDTVSSPKQKTKKQNKKNPTKPRNVNYKN